MAHPCILYNVYSSRLDSDKIHIGISCFITTHLVLQVNFTFWIYENAKIKSRKALIFFHHSDQRGHI